MRVVVVDDEPLARRRLIRMLVALGAEVAGEAGDGLEALEVVRRTRPDLILLDIRMPELDGLALAALPDLPPIVFTTAHADHAVEAFALAATDYLLKPVRRERLAEALRRVRDPEPSRAVVAQLGGARLVVRSGAVTRLFDAARIARIRATDKVSVFVADGVEHVLDESLTELEERLRDAGFLRVHRGELVNLARVVALHRGAGAPALELDDGDRDPVSRRRLAEVEARLGL